VEQQFPGNVIHVASNFRSTDEILRHINRSFEAPLGAQETGYVALESTRQDAGHGLPCVTKVKVGALPDARVDDIRDEEARVVAECCGRLIGNVTIHHGETRPRPLSAGDIALLTPTKTELWRYERALEEAGLPFSSQAGKNPLRRQEAQDLVALVRTLVDSREGADRAGRGHWHSVVGAWKAKGAVNQNRMATAPATHWPCSRHRCRPECGRRS
jgi:CRISPR-associated exonuclease Cas4